MKNPLASFREKLRPNMPIHLALRAEASDTVETAKTVREQRERFEREFPFASFLEREARRYPNGK